MYSSARKYSTLSAICCAINIVGLLLYLMMSASLRLTFASKFAIGMILIASALGFLLLTLGLRSLCQDLDSEYENTNMKFRELNKKIKELESRM